MNYVLLKFKFNFLKVVRELTFQFTQCICIWLNFKKIINVDIIRRYSIVKRSWILYYNFLWLNWYDENRLKNITLNVNVLNSYLYLDHLTTCLWLLPTCNNYKLMLKINYFKYNKDDIMLFINTYRLIFIFK